MASEKKRNRKRKVPSPQICTEDSIILKSKELKDLELQKVDQLQNLNFPEDGNNGADDRGQWTSQLDFIVASLAYAVGLGNIWRFPYLCYRNGGGAFLIPYVIFLLLVGIPIFFLELAIGQYSSRGPIRCWEMCPMFKGLGIAMFIIVSYMNIYYNVIVGWSLYYLRLSFSYVLPWSFCDPKWATPNCVNDFSKDALLFNCTNTTLYHEVDGRCYNASDDMIGYTNLTLRLQDSHVTFPAQEYFQNEFLEMSSSISETGHIVRHIAISLVIAWILLFLCMMKGVMNARKLIYVTVILPYLVLIALGIRGWLLDGAKEGVLFFIKPDVTKLLNAKIWNDAASQIFFSLSTSFGGLIALASYNDFHNNMLRDALVVSVANCLTSIFAGFVIFAYIGNLAFTSQLPIEHVVDSGPGLTFIIYPFAVSQLPFSQLMSCIFFFMLSLLGLDSMFTYLETIVSIILDEFPKLMKFRSLVIFIVCTIFCIMGILFTTQSGIFWVELFNTYAAGWAVLLVSVCECYCIMWVYGWNNLRNDLLLMLGDGYDTKLLDIWYYIWKYISPIINICVIVFVLSETPLLQVSGIAFPAWSYAVGNLMTTFVVLSGIGFALIFSIRIFMKHSSFEKAYSPTKYWGPALSQNRAKVKHLPNFIMNVTKDIEKVTTYDNPALESEQTL
ncbi:hypothetical protein SNEBB_010954 [Seison nebaliae]|nr:hypothetical protein SNEBB_010954 [Seison nebaliae]